MKASLAALCLVLLLAAGPALVPAAALPPDDLSTCDADPCVVDSSVFGFVPPVVVIESGQSVVWTASDVTHRNVDGLLPGDAACFDVEATVFEASPAVRFDVVDGTLTATTAPGTSEESTAPCGNAKTLSGGVFVLPYWCVLHPDMRGWVAVVA